jgi:ADP-ribose pyrophosphatase YjhB (NUDIX family)
MLDVPSTIKSGPESHLSLLKAAFERGETYPDYPSFDSRLFTPLQMLELSADGHPVVPDGPWNLADGSEAILPSQGEQENFIAQGLRLDSKGRPLHPWLDLMLGDATMGALFGKGRFWKWGAGSTADSIVEMNDHILLIERGDTGAMALPGGFINTGEASLSAAIRETFEETDLVLTAIGRQVYHGPVVDLRMTANAWPVTSAYHFDLDHLGRLPKVRGKDDAHKASWVPIEEALGAVLFGSHSILRDMALGKQL